MASDYVALARRAYRAFAAQDVEQLTALSDPDVELHTVTGAVTGRAEPYRGRAGLADYLRDVSAVWDEIELYPHEFLELEDGRVMVLGRVRARREGSTIDTPNAWLWEFREGLVSCVRILGDLDAARGFLR
jgi:ketosteroid isomerase-like protein